MDKKLSIDELLAKVAEVEKPRLRCENNTNTLRYIEEMGFEAGTQAIPTYVIFWHYRTVWGTGSDARNYKANKTVFFRTFNKKFPTYRKNTQRYYLLKEGAIELTEQVLKDAKIYDKKCWSRKKKVRLPEQEGSLED